MAKPTKSQNQEGQVQMSTPQIDVENAKNVVKYFENMKKANEEILKMIEYNLKESREQLRQREKIASADPDQIEVFPELQKAN